MTIDISELRRLALDGDLAAMQEIILRLKAAEKSDAESLAMYRKARDERDALRAALQHEADCVEAAKAEIAALRAKIAKMEQQEPSEQYASVRKAWARFSHELHRSPDAPYPGMADAFEQHFSQSFTDRDWRVESEVWAAAWKAAKRHGAKGE